MFLQVLFALLQLSGNRQITVASENLTNLVHFINEQQKLSLNIVINLNNSKKYAENFQELLKNNTNPRLIINHVNNYTEELMPIHRTFSKQVLTLAWLTNENFNETFNAMDRLLWKLHFKDIILVYTSDAAKEMDLMEIFEKCWSKGFISVLLVFRDHLYTYHPYPNIKAVLLKKPSDFLDKSHLNNFQQKTCLLPFFDFANYCFNYTNRQGQLVRCGYYYKWIELYLNYYNASIKYDFIDMWSNDIAQYKDVVNDYQQMPYCLIPIFLKKFQDKTTVTDSLFLTRIFLITPNVKEITLSSYLALPFNGFILFMIMLTAAAFGVVINFMQQQIKIVKDFSKLSLEALRIVLFISQGTQGNKSMKFFLLQLLILFTGIFITTYYSSSLSSMLTAKVYEVPLRTFRDLRRIDQNILEYTTDINDILQLDLPEDLKKRFRTGDNTDMHQLRRNLNMTYMYTAHEELADFILFQQTYMKTPIARKLDQVLNYRHHYITAPKRSPIIDHINTFLLRIRSNGLMEKILEDTKRDGILSGELTMFLDPEENKSLTLEHLYYAFLLWFVGLTWALVMFLLESLWYKYSQRGLF